MLVIDGNVVEFTSRNVIVVLPVRPAVVAHVKPAVIAQHEVLRIHRIHPKFALIQMQGHRRARVLVKDLSSNQVKSLSPIAAVREPDSKSPNLLIILRIHIDISKIPQLGHEVKVSFMC